jgi:outer membrane protein assembly factor BamD
MSTRSYFAAAIGVLLALQAACSSTPPYQGLTVDDLYDLGVREYEAEDWDEAIRAFERVIFQDPTYSRLVEARIHLARAYSNKGEHITAVSEFTRILDRHPGHVLAPEAAMGICRSFAALSPIVERDQTYTLQAFTACENVTLDFGGHQVSLEAEEFRRQMEEKLAGHLLNAGDYYFRRKYFDSALIYYNLVLADYPQTATVAQALLRMYRSYTEIGWETEAEEARERLLTEYPESDAAREVRTNGGGTEPIPGGVESGPTGFPRPSGNGYQEGL